MLDTPKFQLPSFRKFRPYLVVFTFMAIAVFLQNIFANKIEGTVFTKAGILFSQVIVFDSFAILIPVITHLGKVYPIKSQKLLSHLVLHLLVSILLSAIHLMFSQIVYHLFWEMPGETFYGKLSTTFQRWFYIEVLIYWVILIATKSREVLKEQENVVANGKIGVKHKGQTLLLDFDELNWIQAYDAYVKVYTNDKVYLKRSKISDVEKILPPHQFQRIHRSAIVNTSKIKALEPYYNGEQFIILQNNEKLKLSRSYKGKLSQLSPA